MTKPTKISEVLNKKDYGSKAVVQPKASYSPIDALLGSLPKVPDSLKVLNPNQQKFVVLYCSDREFFGNGVESYAEAYDKNISDPKQYNICRSQASQLLTNLNVLKAIDDILESSIMNEAWIDKQLAFVATQNADFGAKMSAIREYNKLKGRIIDKSVTMHGKMPEPLLGGDSRKKIKPKVTVDGEVIKENIVETEVIDGERVIDEEVVVVKRKDKKP